jgi:hypothetical protein
VASSSTAPSTTPEIDHDAMRGAIAARGGSGAVALALVALPVS